MVIGETYESIILTIGQIGYSYQVINETLPLNPEKQFIRFIRPKSD